MALLASFHGEQAIEIEYDPVPLRYWTGAGSLTFDGRTYKAGGILSMNEAGIEADEPIEAFGFTLAAITADERTQYWNEDHGPVPVTVRWLWRISSADAWQQAAEYAGRIDTLDYSTGVLTVTIRTVAWDVDRGETLYMDNATQQRLYPGDKSFEYTGQITAAGGACCADTVAPGLGANPVRKASRDRNGANESSRPEHHQGQRKRCCQHWR